MPPVSGSLKKLVRGSGANVKWSIDGVALGSLDGTAILLDGEPVDGVTGADALVTVADLPYNSAEGADYYILNAAVHVHPFQYRQADGTDDIGRMIEIFNGRHLDGDTRVERIPTPGVQGVQGASEVDVYAVTDNVGDVPDPPAQAVGGSVVVATLVVSVDPAGWSSSVVVPGAGQTAWFCRTFINPATQSGTVTPIWDGPGELGGQGPPGRSIRGDTGNKGWSPIYGAVDDGADRVVLRNTGWTGGEGNRPAGGFYAGGLGQVDTPGAATNIKGNPGEAGEDADLADVQSIADQRIREGVEQFARDTDTDIPVGKFDQVVNAIDTILGSDDWQTGGMPGQAGRKAFATNSDVATTSNLGTALNDIIIETGGDSITIWRRTSAVSPYLTQVGTVQDVTAQVAAEIADRVEGWAIKNNASAIPPGKLSGVINWARINNAAALIPLNKMSVAITNRLLPAATEANNGKIAKIAGGVWAIGTDEQGEGGGGQAAGLADSTRFRFVNGVGAQAGKVFFGFEFVDRYDTSQAFPTRTSLDVGSFGYMPADITRNDYVISQADALDLKSYLGSAGLTVAMSLVTNLPNLANADWGALYGRGPNGQVNDVFYKRRESTTEQLFIPARLPSILLGPSAIHGFTTLAVDYGPGGALSPEAEIVELIERSQPNGDTFTRLILPRTSPLAGSDISALLYWKSDDQDYSVDRELTLVHDSSFVSAVNKRYLSAVYSGYKFTPGYPFDLTWRLPGAANYLELHSEDRLVRVSDQEDLVFASGKLQQEIYKIDDRLVAVEAAEGGEGGGGFAAPVKILNNQAADRSTTRADNWIGSPSIADGDELEFVFNFTTGGKQEFIIKGRMWNELALQSGSPSDGVQALEFKMTGGGTGLSTFGHGTLRLWRRADGLYNRVGRNNDGQNGAFDAWHYVHQ